MEAIKRGTQAGEERELDSAVRSFATFLPFLVAIGLAAAPFEAAGTPLEPAGTRDDFTDARPDLTDLHVAAREGDVARLVQLLDAGLPTDARTLDGTTPLMLAAEGGHVDVVRVLIARGARVGAIGELDQTALALAKAQNHSAVVQVLQRAAPKGAAPRPRRHRTPPPSGGAEAWQPSIPPWSPDPLVLGIPRATDRLSTLLMRIDRAEAPMARPAVPSYRPLERWIGERFLFLPADPGMAHEYPSFETREEISSYRFEPSYQELAGRIGVVIGVGAEGEQKFVDIRLDGEPVVVRGHVRPSGEIPEIAPVRDLAIARRLFLGRTAWPRGVAVTKYRLPAGRPVKILAIAPASTSRNPIRLLVEGPGGQRQTLDAALSATNVPLVDGRRSFDPLLEMLELMGSP